MYIYSNVKITFIHVQKLHLFQCKNYTYLLLFNYTKKMPCPCTSNVQSGPSKASYLAPQPNFFWLLSQIFQPASAEKWLLSRIFCFGSSAEFFILAPQPNFFFLHPYQILRLIVLKTPPLNCSYGLKTTMNFNLTVHTALWR